MGCRVTYDVDEAIADADIINLLRIQHERQRQTMFPSIGEYTKLFGLTKQRLASPSRHPHHASRPVNRGVEIDSDVADCGRSLILEQVTNGLAVRMAVLFWSTRQRPRKSAWGDPFSHRPRPRRRPQSQFSF